MGHVIGYKNKIYPKGTGGGGSGSNVEPNPQDTPTDTLETIGIDGVVYEIEGGGGGTVYDMKDYYGQNGRICNGSARQFLTANFVKPLEVGRMYIIDFKNSEGGSIVASAVFTYNQDFSPTMYGGGSIGTIDMSITSTTITCTWYTGSWQDIYVDVYREISSAEFYHPVIYSTEEREIGVWTDNKPLYQKTFNGSWLLNGTSWSGVIANIPNAELKKAECLDEDGQSMGINGSIDGSGNLTLFNLRNADLMATSVTIQYTKTTDTAGSGSYNTLGVPTVHYTTDEQVIGTWVDGKPLYEKTFTGLSQATNGADWVTVQGVNIPSVKDLINATAWASGGGGEQIKITLAESTAVNDGVRVSVISSSWNRTINKMTVQYTKTTD